MKVVSFTGGAAEVYAGLRATVTGNASGETPLAQEVIFMAPLSCNYKVTYD
ncbi:hypothetical protein OZL92_13715 [Bacillus sonorensis]|uniref:hypothetical protein n=1 Tax=Bacillus TaxID=1386 RepID=UPI000344A7B8|nr:MULTISPECIES: hypothetical protein [Bacillus]TWK85165.1 hypothetical protein CHCC20335_3329 [Bacillus paralicheniformis]MCF7618774.1 hypothetical protein [Bacillus sonorensis]MCY7855129.1 hypothetical protein [Bacillus sonorensis]MCY8024600.1 hypothetical protein [Bacillus sonorensis]MCY8032005.1 hypothetical protein [Bacillus sonorensis]